jgi:hypothetical protein
MKTRKSVNGGNWGGPSVGRSSSDDEKVLGVGDGK